MLVKLMRRVEAQGAVCRASAARRNLCLLNGRELISSPDPALSGGALWLHQAHAALTVYACYRLFLLLSKNSRCWYIGTLVVGALARGMFALQVAPATATGTMQCPEPLWAPTSVRSCELI